MNILDKVYVYKNLELGFWGDQFESNNHFSSWTNLLIMLFSAAYAACMAINSIFNIHNMDFTLPVLLYFLAIFVILNIGESIMVAPNFKTGLLRSLLYIGIAIAFGAVGALLSLLIIAAIMIVILILGIYIFIKFACLVLFGNSDKNTTAWTLDNGTTVTKQDNLLGGSTYEGDDGRLYRNNGDGTFTPL